MQLSIEQTYPQVADWVTTQGWIEVGYDEASRSFVRPLDSGGMVWEGASSYPSLDDALRVVDIALGEWLQAAGIQRFNHSVTWVNTDTMPPRSTRSG
jgi:hypothetical protein